MNNGTILVALVSAGLAGALSGFVLYRFVSWLLREIEVCRRHARRSDPRFWKACTTVPQSDHCCWLSRGCGNRVVGSNLPRTFTTQCGPYGCKSLCSFHTGVGPLNFFLVSCCCCLGRHSLSSYT